MTDSAPDVAEQRLAEKHNQEIERGMVAQRTRYVVLVAFFFVAGFGFVLAGYWMLGLLGFVSGLIFLSQYFDVNGNIHEVRRRSTKTLVPNFSVLRLPSDDTQAAPSGASSRQAGH
ncbi:MAG: hypothetical protein MI757_20030 [Pirellulales bacterium]|nr:hypothetical protein [Pirellulales bacterium]